MAPSTQDERLTVVARGSKLLRDLVALSSGQVFSKLVGFLTFGYLARTLGPESYGTVEFATGIVVFSTKVIDCGLGPVGVRRLAQSSDRLPVLAAQIPGAKLLIALLVVPSICLAVSVLGLPLESVRLMWLFSLALLAVPWDQQWLLQGLEKMKLAAAAMPLRMTAFGIGVVLLVRTEADLLAVGVAELGAAVVFTTYLLLVQQRWLTPVRLRVSFAAFRELTAEGISLGLSGMLWALVQYLPLFFVATLVSAEETAWFGASHRIVFSLLVFSYLYHFNLYPALTRRMSSIEKLVSLTSASFRVVAWASVLIALVLTMLSEPILGIVFGLPFTAAAPTFSILIWTLPVTLLSGHARWVLTAAGLQRSVLAAHLVAAVAMLTIGFAAVSGFQARGAAAAVVLVSLVAWATAHHQASTRVTVLPGVRGLVLPLALAGCGGWTGQFLALSPWAAVAIATLIYCAGAWLLDKRLLADLKYLAAAKSEVGPSSSSNG